MWEVAILCDDLQPLNRLCVANNVVEVDWAVLFDPALELSVESCIDRASNLHTREAHSWTGHRLYGQQHHSGDLMRTPQR